MILSRIRKKSIHLASILVPLLGAATAVQAADPFVVTASNATANQLLVYSPSGNLLQTLSTKGAGGATGNAGGVQTSNGLVAVVNFGSQSVSIFQVGNSGLSLTQVVPTVTKPVSVAFGENHLYILGATQVESHAIFGDFVNTNPDGISTLLVADGSAAQVGVLTNQIIVSEKSNVIETFDLLADGAVSGNPTLVAGIPSDAGIAVNGNEPFGLVTSGKDAYVTIAHLNQVALVRRDAIVNSGFTTQNAPCWATLTGPFLFTSNTASKNLSRFVVHGRNVVLDAAVATPQNFAGNVTDDASGSDLVAAIDVSGGSIRTSHLTIFHIDEDGNLTNAGISGVIPGAVNGVAIVPSRF
jgi:hypothetical protein